MRENFRGDLKDVSVFDGLTAKETVPDRRWSIRNRPLTKRVRAHRGKTKKGVLLVRWFVNVKELNQISRSSRVEAVVAPKSESQDKRAALLYVLSISFSLFMRYEDSQTGENCGSQGVKELGFLWHLSTDSRVGTSATKFKNS